MAKNYFKIYPKYKREAYNNLKDLAVRLLKESDFYVRTGYSEKTPIVIGNDLRFSINGMVNFYINEQWVLSIFGTSVSGWRNCNSRENLTFLEEKVFKESVEKLFQHAPNKSVSSVLGSPIRSWIATESYCEFISVDGLRYQNSNKG